MAGESRAASPDAPICIDFLGARTLPLRLEAGESIMGRSISASDNQQGARG